MNRFIVFGFLCIACANCHSTASIPPALSATSPLDESVTAPAEAASQIYRDHVEAVREMAAELGKKLILPEGLMEFLVKFNGGDPDFKMGSYLAGKMESKISIKDYFTDYGRSSLFLDCAYDSSQCCRARLSLAQNSHS